MNFQIVAEAYFHKLDNHLWCVSERLCVLSLFSSKVNLAEKKIVCKTLVKQKMLSQPRNQNMPVVTFLAHLNDFGRPRLLQQRGLRIMIMLIAAKR